MEPGDDIATAVRQELAKDTTARRYRHIVIDEGQDLSPEALRSLAEAAQHGGSVTFFGDYHQAIYGQGLSWRSAGLNLGARPVERFVDNYRNTAAIAHLAIALSQTPAMASGDEDLVIPKVPVAAGPPPHLGPGSGRGPRGRGRPRPGNRVRQGPVRCDPRPHMGAGRDRRPRPVVPQTRPEMHV